MKASFISFDLNKSYVFFPKFISKQTNINIVNNIEKLKKFINFFTSIIDPNNPNLIFTCVACNRQFDNSFEYLKHKRLNHSKNASNQRNNFLQCIFCGLICSNLINLRNHLSQCVSLHQKFKCNYCSQFFNNKHAIITHIIKENRMRGSGLSNRIIKLSKNSKFLYSKSSFKGTLQLFELYPDRKYIEIEKFIIDYKNELIDIMKKSISLLKSIKIQFCIQCTFSRNVGDQILFTIAYFCNPNTVINIETDLNSFISKLIEFFNTSVENFENLGSGWVLFEIDRLDYKLGLYLPMVAGCDKEKLPTELKNKRALISVKSKENDDKCLLYCILSFIAIKENEKRTKTDLPKIVINRLSALKQFIEYLKTDRLKYPAGIKEIKYFEKDNQHLDIKINLYGWEYLDKFNQSMVPLYISERKAKHIINILKFQKHYYLIKIFNRLMSSKYDFKRKFCYRCLSGFRSDYYLNRHLNLCKNFKPALIKMPDKKEYFFNDYQKTYNHLFVIFVDFEALLQKTEIKLSDKVKQIHAHIPSTYSMIVVKDYFQVIYKNTYTGSDCMRHFFKRLRIVVSQLSGYILNSFPMDELTEEQITNFNSARFCGICKKPFDSESDKVRDHDHLTGKYRQAAHKLCNIKYQIPTKIPVICHNLKNYDSNFMIEALSKRDVFKNCTVIPQTFEKFIAFQIDEIVVIDSYQFLNESLEVLANNLKKSKNDFKITKNIFSNLTENNPELNNLLFQKSVFPYEYIDSFERLDEKQLPPIDKFYSSLNDETISSEKYEFAKKVWSSFNFNTLKEYQEFYCLLDTSLLADIFQTFRQKIYQIYELDCCHFYSIPGLSWAAAMKYTNAQLELIQDVDIYQFVETGIRGGICGVMQRKAKANNTNIASYDSTKPTTFICHVDVNK